MEIPAHLTCLLRNLYAGQEATIRTGREITDWFQIGKGVFQGSILSACLPKALLFTLYAANCYSLTRSRPQCHIFRSISWFFTPWTPPEIFPLLTALLFPPRTWTICNNGPASLCSLHRHPHLDSSSVNVPPCLSTHVLVPFTLPVPCWTREPSNHQASLL